jgi:periplasmic copper chaperone A
LWVRLPGVHPSIRRSNHQSTNKKRTMKIKTCLQTATATAAVALLMGIGMGQALAHVTLLERTVVQGTYFRAAFKVGHGCEGSPTTQIVVDLPEGVVGAKPMPKAGWEVRTDIQRLAVPYDAHGKTITERVARVSWTGGSLPDAQYDEFVMQVQVLAGPGPIWFAVNQVCEKGNNPWTEIPASGTSTQGIPFPAALLEVVAPTVPAHQH